MILQLLSYVGVVVGFSLLVLAIACGLYYLSEQVEEHSVLAKKLLLRLICGVTVCHILLWLVDGLPFWKSTFSIVANGIYLQTLSRFPLVHLTSPSFLLACVAAVINHLIWFQHFGGRDIPPHSIKNHIPDYAGETHPPFSEVAAFLGLLVWLVPLLLFISLSAGDNMLPVAHEQERPKKRKGLAKEAVERVWDFVAQLLRTLGVDVPSPYDRIA